VTGFTSLFLIWCPQEFGQIDTIPRQVHGTFLGIELPS
jgi:hypothetical protein